MNSGRASLPPDSTGPKLAHIQEERNKTVPVDGHDKVPSYTSTCNGSWCCSHLWKGQSATWSFCSPAKSDQINQAASMCGVERTMLNIHQSHFFNRLSHASWFTLSASRRAAAAVPHTSAATLRKCPRWQCFPSSSWSQGLVQKHVSTQISSALGWPPLWQRVESNGRPRTKMKKVPQGVMGRESQLVKSFSKGSLATCIKI